MLLLSRKVQVAVPRDLTPITSADAAGAVDLHALGMTRRDVGAIWSAVEGLYRTGLHPAISICVRRMGQVVLDRAIGHASGAGPGDLPGEPAVLATPATPFCIFSASKAITAILIHHLDDQGLLHIDDRVAEYVPEFACRGKETTTIRHVLTHRAGIPSLPSGNVGEERDLRLLLDWERVIDLLCQAEPTWKPGRRLAYHAITGGFVLGEIIRRVTGRTPREYLHDVVLGPLGFRYMNFGVDAHDRGLVARNYATGRQVPFPFSIVVQRALGVDFPEAVKISNDPRWLESVVPAGNIVGTANEVSRFYQLLLQGGELDGVRVFDQRTIRRATTESSYLEVDLTLGFPVHYGLGLMLGSEVASLFGPNTPQAFGHLGFIHVLTWADPQRQLSVGLLTSGKPFLGAHLGRVYKVLAAISRHCPPIS